MTPLIANETIEQNTSDEVDELHLMIKLKKLEAESVIVEGLHQHA